MDCDCGNKDLETVRRGVCSCHINPPCSSCVDAPFVCGDCGEIYEVEHPSTKPLATAYVHKPYKARTLDDLDRAKIDYIHTGNGGRSFHDIAGYCPQGTTKNDILTHLRILSRPCLPKFKSFASGGYFHLSYFID